ncbi:MAG: hypothetical protein ACLPND_13790 [Candidatus Korobacteraceae bacterium]|jgi:hypothetical protein
MKRLLLLLVCFIFFILSLTMLAQDAQPAADAKFAADSAPSGQAQPTAASKPGEPQERMWFPKDWYWGWAQFDLAPPHNEVDPNLCAGNAGQYGGKNSECSAFARYMISGTIELRPIGQTWARGLMMFFDPTFLFGKTVPQYNYTWSWSGIGMEYAWGVGFDLPKRFEVRFTGHPTIQRFPARDHSLGPAFLGPNGPWGQYNTIGVRKYFGTRREGTY